MTDMTSVHAEALNGVVDILYKEAAADAVRLDEISSLVREVLNEPALIDEGCFYVAGKLLSMGVVPIYSPYDGQHREASGRPGDASRT